MKSRINNNVVPALLVLAVLVVSSNAWLAFRSIDVLVDSEAWVRHTWEVIDQVEKLMVTARDGGAGNLRFLIGKDDGFIEIYRVSSEQLRVQVDRLQDLTRDNAEQQANVRQFRAQLTPRVAMLGSLVERRSHGVLTPDEAFAANEAIRSNTDRLRKLADTMVREEQGLLAMRERATETSARRLRMTIGVASFIDLLLIVLMLRFVDRERTMRLATEEVAANLAASRVQLETTSAEVQALNRTLEERVRLRTVELETTNRELEAFSYSVSHDLRAPLRTIDGFSLALEEDYADAVDEAGKDYIKRVRTGVQRMGELIDALLQLSRITRAAIQRESFDLSELATSIAEDLGQLSAGRDLKFQIAPGCIVKADHGLMRVALENLLGNAVKFSGKVPHAVVEFGWDAAESAWFVRDNGAGFDMHYAGKLFNAFNRLHGDRDFKGSGIGLATVARVIQRHHGKIWADSVVDRGATFWFTLG